MKLAIIGVQLAILIGCSSRGEAVKMPERYLLFTSDFPSSVYWELNTDFTTTTESSLCKSYSANSGELVKSKKHEQFQLKESGDTMKVPLFWAKSSPCKWELQRLYFGLKGRCINMHQISLNKVGKEADSEKGMSFSPDSISYGCELTSEGDCLVCSVKNGAAKPEFSLDESRQILKLHVDVKGF
ncbi:MAG: hypothetical protein ABIW76_04705 [Fibrobacteria bacterium]